MPCYLLLAGLSPRIRRIQPTMDSLYRFVLYAYLVEIIIVSVVVFIGILALSFRKTE